MCGLLGVPFFVQNTEREFATIIESFADSYARGETPNPCVACNGDVKFGALLRRAQSLGAGAVATGHYARRVRYGERWAIARAKDRDKDQSYVLYMLDQPELEHARFPLGDLVKSEVRALAREAKLPVADKLESQEICFVPTGDYRDVVREKRPDAFLPGEVVDPRGIVIGRHPGVGSFTVGQRKGLGLDTAEPHFVVGLDPVKRRVMVAPRAELGVSAARVGDARFTAIDAPLAGIDVDVVVRYRAEPVRATVTADGHGNADIAFHEPAWPVTPGQAAVFYDGDVVLGGGRIRPCS